MVHGHQQHVVVVGQADEGGADGRPALQVERRVHLPRRQRLQRLAGVRAAAQVVLHEAEPALLRGDDALLRLARHGHEDRAQRLVPGHDALQGARQGRAVQRAPQAQALRQVVGAAQAPQLLQEPQPLLGKGKRQPAVPLHGRDGRDPGRAALQLGGARHLQEPFALGGGQHGIHGMGTVVAGCARGDGADG